MYQYGPRHPRKRVKPIAHLDMTLHERYKNSILIRVEGGRGDLCRRGTPLHYCVALNDYNLCGIKSSSAYPLLKPYENMNCIIKYVKESMKVITKDANLNDYIDVIMPLLASLEDGYYVILDALLYPATGNQDFFLEINAGDTPMDALNTPAEKRGGPAYIFPTAAISSHMNTYNPYELEKAICYYIDGSLSLMLSGHDLAVHSATMGHFLPSLVIVPCTEVLETGAFFADVFVSMDMFPTIPTAYRINPYRITREKDEARIKKESHCDMNYRSLWKNYPLASERCKLFNNNAELQEVKTPLIEYEKIHLEKLPHYKSAVFITVKNGKRELVKKGINGISKLFYKQNALMQIYEYGFDDEKMRLAPLFGETEDESEIRQTVSNIAAMQSQNITEYAEAVKPILDLLPDGYYVLVDMMLYPSTGSGYFWNIRNYPAKYAALEDPRMGYARPAYIMPTVHSGLFKDGFQDSVSYAEMLDPATPDRAIAYYLDGYMTALLYGHNLAATSAYSKKELPSLVIIPYCDLVASNSHEALGRFADIVLPIKNVDLAEQSKMVKQVTDYKKLPEISLMSSWSEQYLNSFASYPTPEQMMAEAEWLRKNG